MSTRVPTGVMALVCATGLLVTAQSLAQPSPARAEPGVEIGRLVCRMPPNISFILGSVRELKCTFTPKAGGKGESYKGEIRRYGIDVGVNGPGRLVWTVIAVSPKAAPSDLRGGYLGAAGDASVGGGLGANVLVGGNSNSISLQPVSVQKQVGLNVGLGISRLTLR